MQLSGFWAHQSDCELQVINSKHSLSGVETLKVWLDGYKGNANSNGEQLASAFFTASLTFAVLTLSMTSQLMLCMQ